MQACATSASTASSRRSGSRLFKCRAVSSKCWRRRRSASALPALATAPASWSGVVSLSMASFGLHEASRVAAPARASSRTAGDRERRCPAAPWGNRAGSPCKIAGGKSDPALRAEEELFAARNPTPVIALLAHDPVGPPVRHAHHGGRVLRAHAVAFGRARAHHDGQAGGPMHSEAARPPPTASATVSPRDRRRRGRRRMGLNIPRPPRRHHSRSAVRRSSCLPSHL